MRRADFAVLTIAVVMLLSATVPWIGQLGLEYDEAHFLPLAIKIAFGAEERLDPPWGYTIADRPIPFVTMPYVGTLDSFIYAVPYRMFGTTVLVSRGTDLVLATVVLILAWWIARRESGSWAGAGVLALLLVDVEWVLHAPTNFGPILMQQLLALAAIAALQQWWRKGRGLLFFAAVAALAFAFHEKLTFIWVLSSLSLGIVLFKARDTWQNSRWWYYPAGLALAIAIVSPIIYFAFAVPEIIFGFGKANTKMPADWGVLLRERWHVFDLMLRGSWTIDWSAGVMPGTPHRGPALLILFFCGLGAAIWKRHSLALVLYTTALGVWFWNLGFPDAGRMHHVLLMAPFWQIGAAVAIGGFGLPLRSVALAFVLWAGWDASRSYVWYSGQVGRTGGVNHWSDMTTRAWEWLNANPQFDAVTTCWGVGRPVFVLSGGRINPVEHYFDILTEPLAPATVAQLKELIAKQRQVWLVSDVMPSNDVQWQRVVVIAKGEGRMPQRITEFASRDGLHRITAYTFNADSPAPVEWTTTASKEFAVKPAGFRIHFQGRSTSDSDELLVDWLDSEGAICFTDSRNFHWVPHLGSQSRFEFTDGYWPASFHRQRQSGCQPVKAKIRASFKQASIAKIEVPSP